MKRKKRQLKCCTKEFAEEGKVLSASLRKLRIRTTIHAFFSVDRYPFISSEELDQLTDKIAAIFE